MLKKLICLTAGIAIALSAYGYTPTQLDLFHVAEQHGQVNGTSEWLKAIMMKESKAGIGGLVGAGHLPLAQRSFGVMQVQIVAARSVLRHHPALAYKWFDGKRATDAELAKLLTYNHEANIEVASKHFDLYIRLCDGNIPKAVVAYNVGIGNVRNIKHIESHPYLQDVRRTMKNLPTLDA